MVRTENVSSYRELRGVTHKPAGLLLHPSLTGAELALNPSPGVVGCPQKGAFGMRQLGSPFDCFQRKYFCC